jgi:hypothetical protein
MNKHMDLFLAKVLNQWVAKHRPPAEVRERLLQKAAAPIRHSPNIFGLSWLIGQEAFRPDIFGTELSRKVTGWIYLPFQPRYGYFSVV